MRVLLLTGPIGGGIKKHVEALLDALPDAGVECALVGPVPPSQEMARWIRLGLDEHPASALSLGRARALRELCQEGPWDLVHAHGYKAATLAALAAVRAPGLRYVVTLHNLRPPMGLAAWLLTRAALGRARAVIGVSRAVLDTISSMRIRPERQIVISNGVAWQRFAELPDRTQARAALGLAGEWTALFLGRLTGEKGVFTYARAAGILYRRRALYEPSDADWVFLAAGEGPAKPLLLRYTRTTKALRLLGERNDLPALFAASDVVVVPSLREGQSLVALEAMAAGRPLLVSNVGGLGELARASDAAWTMPPADAGALAVDLAMLMRYPDERARLGAGGRAYARLVGDWRQMAERVAAVYRQLLEEP